MTRILSLLFIVFSFLPASSQEIPFQFKKSELFKDEFKFSTIKLVEDDGAGGVIIVRSFQGGMFSTKGGYYFERYDSDMKLIKEFEFELKYSEMVKASKVLGVIMDGNKVHIIDFVYNKAEKAYVCSANSASIDDFQFTKKEIFKLPYADVNKSGMSLFGGSYDSDFGASMIVNEGKTAFAITVDLVDYKIETHKLYLFDNSLNQKLDHTFKRDIKDRRFRYENIDVSADGKTLYLLGKVFTKEKKKKKEGGKYQYELTRVTSDSEITQVFDTDAHFVGSLRTMIFKNKLTCVGFYSDRKDNRYKGICYFELDPETLSVRSSKYNPFTEQFIIDKYGKEKDKELKNLSFRSFLITPADEIVFNAEEYYEVTTTYMSNGVVHSTTTYHYDDIVSAKLSQEGEIIWARNINKRQSTSGDGAYISYTSTIKGDNTYFFINTGEKVKKLSKDRIRFGQTNAKKSNLNIIRINKDGDFDYQEILDDKDNEVPFMVADGALSPESNSVFFIGRKGKKKQILKVTL